MPRLRPYDVGGSGAAVIGFSIYNNDEETHLPPITRRD
jgi:hypothetical protein